MSEQGPGHDVSTRRRGVPWGLVVLAVLVGYALLFVLLNGEDVNVNFVLFSADTSLVVALALALGLGFVLGFFADIVRARRRRRTAAASRDRGAA